MMNWFRRDPSLPHQIILNFKNGSGTVQVSCNCQLQDGFTFRNYKTIAYLETDEPPWASYNNPQHHKVNKGVPFEFEDQVGPPQARLRRADFEALLVELGSYDQRPKRHEAGP